MFQGQSMGVPGVQTPDFLSKLPTMQQQNQSSADRARLSMAGGMGMNGLVGNDGKFDAGKIMGVAKKFCL